MTNVYVPMPKGCRLNRYGTAIQIRFRYNGADFKHTIKVPPTEQGLRAGAAEAAKRRAQMVADAKQGLLHAGNAAGPSSLVTFGQAAKQYLESRELARSTWLAYRNALNLYWRPLFQDRLEGISRKRLRQVAGTTRWASPATYNKALSPLRQVFEFAIRNDLLEDNPAERLEYRKQKAVEPDPFLGEERRTLLTWMGDHASPQANRFYRLAFATGMRTGEILALQWQDVDFAEGRIRVCRARVRGSITGPKNGRDRWVYPLDDLMAELKRWPTREAGGYLFVKGDGEPYYGATKLCYHKTFAGGKKQLTPWLQYACDQTGVRMRTGVPYPWRHTFVSRCLSAGVEPFLVAEMAGHSVTMMLRHYAKFLPAGKKVRAELAKVRRMETDAECEAEA